MSIARRATGFLSRAVPPHKAFRWVLNLYPPYLLAGIRMTQVSPTLDRLTMRMGLYPWNRNYVGTQFGGSLYSMCDPLYMLMLMQRMGPAYIVWDKAASIRYVRPGKSAVFAHFHLPGERVAELKEQLETQPKVDATFEVDVVNTDGDVIAHVTKVIHLRKKR